MSELFSEMGKGSTYVRPEFMWVIKATNRSYSAYYNAHKNKWGGLLEATIYTGEVPEIKGGEIVDYRVITGLKK